MSSMPRCHQQRFAKGETILEQGARGDRTFVIKAGNVLVCKEGDVPGEMVPIESLGPGELFGEMYLVMNDLTRTATVVAVNEVTVDVFFEEEVLRDLDNMSFLQRMMFKGLNSRLRKTTENLTRQKVATEYTSGSVLAKPSKQAPKKPAAKPDYYS